MKKTITVILTLTMTAALFAGCGKNNAGEQAAALEGTCAEILEKVYEKADLDEELRESMEYYQNTPVDAESAEYILGTADLNYTDSVYSAPMMSSIAYQCVLLRLEKDADVEAAKKLLSEKADPRKWICVEAESVAVEHVGDVILYIMADQKTADAVKTAFLALGEA